MNFKLLITIALGILGVVVIGFLLGLGMEKSPLGQAQSGFYNNLATSSAQVVTAGAPTIFATSTVRCTSRVITVNAGGNIMLTFSDRLGQVPTASLGHYQAASTTVTYDSGLFGCNAVKAYGTGVTITVSEFQ